MPGIRSGILTAFYLFDVAEAIDLPAASTMLGGAGQSARLNVGPATPPHAGYQTPPLLADAQAVGVAPADGWQVRLKLFDYGVLSLSFTCAFSGSWDDLARSAQALAAGALEVRARNACATAVQRLAATLREAHATALSEDYLVFAVTALDAPATADALIAAHGDDIARVLRGEVDALAMQERDEVLRHRLSYRPGDLVVASWNAAFVLDTEAGLVDTLELLEFANSQLLEFRYYDQRLERELQRIYARLKATRWYEPWIGRRYTAAAREVHALLIDVNELTDRTENALKLVGDVYAARLLGLAAARLGLPAWKDSVRDKLGTLDDIYRFAVDQTAMDRGEMLEIAVVVILVVELALLLLGIMH